MSAPDDTGRRPCGCPHDATGAIGALDSIDADGPLGMTRRRLLGAAGAAAALGVVGSAVSGTVATRLAFAGTAYTGDTLVVLSMRGGFDGLSAVVPAADPAYAGLRPNIGIPASGLLPVDATFGLHPALSPLKPLWDAGSFGAVHAVGQVNPTRSHFQAMEEMERAAPGSSVRTGWLDRVSGAMGPGPAYATVGVGLDGYPSSLIGPQPELLMSSIDDFELSGAWDATEASRWTKALRTMHAPARADVKGAATTTLDALSTAAALRAATYTPENGAAYPDGDLGAALRDVARLVKADVGLRVATVDYGDWDMHVGLGRSDQGWMFDKLTELSAALLAFATDLGGRMGRVTLVTLSEFGRRVAENASGGLDHGHGNVMFLLGGAVAGGRVHGRWTGLASSALDQGDLPANTDYRTVLAEVLERRCGMSAASVFPGLGSARLGVVT